MKRLVSKMISAVLCMMLVLSCFAVSAKCAEKSLGEKISDALFKENSAGQPIFDYQEREISVELLEVLLSIEDIDSLVETFSEVYSVFSDYGKDGKLNEYGLSVETVTGLAMFLKEQSGNINLDKARYYLGLPDHTTENPKAFEEAVNNKSVSLENALRDQNALDSLDKVDKLFSRMEVIFELFKMSQVIHQTVFEYYLDSEKLTVFLSGIETAIDNFNLIVNDEEIKDSEMIVKVLEKFTEWYNDAETNINDKKVIYDFLKKYFFLRQTDGQMDDEPDNDDNDANDDDNDDSNENNNDSEDGDSDDNGNRSTNNNDKDTTNTSMSDEATTNEEEISSAVINEKLQEPQWDWVRDEINELYEDDVDLLRPYEEFDPAELVTRSEFTAMVARLLSKAGDYVGMTFKDVPLQHIYIREISGAERAGYVNGISITERIFSPDTDMTRQEMATEIVNVMVQNGYIRDNNTDSIVQLEDYGLISDWAVYNVASIYRENMELEAHSQRFFPREIPNFAEAAVMIYRLRDRLKLK